MSKHRLTAYIYLLIVSVIWGVASPIIKFTLAEFPPLIFLTYRFAIASVIAFLFWRGLPKLPHASGKLTHLFLYSFLAVPITLGLLFWGYSETSSIEGALISAVAPLFGAITAAWYFRERITKSESI